MASPVLFRLSNEIGDDILAFRGSPCPGVIDPRAGDQLEELLGPVLPLLGHRRDPAADRNHHRRQGRHYPDPTDPLPPEGGGFRWDSPRRERAGWGGWGTLEHLSRRPDDHSRR